MNLPPVDFIAGTSIGAVIAGACASGMDDLEELLGDVDWGELFRGAPVRRDLTFRRKQDSRSSSSDSTVGASSCLEA
jgi:NTE family protein